MFFILPVKLTEILAKQRNVFVNIPLLKIQIPPVFSKPDPKWGSMWAITPDPQNFGLEIHRKSNANRNHTNHIVANSMYEIFTQAKILTMQVLISYI